MKLTKRGNHWVASIRIRLVYLNRAVVYEQVGWTRDEARKNLTKAVGPV
jgi:hypothetical protein